MILCEAFSAVQCAMIVAISTSFPLTSSRRNCILSTSRCASALWFRQLNYHRIVPQTSLRFPVLPSPDSTPRRRPNATKHVRVFAQKSRTRENRREHPQCGLIICFLFPAKLSFVPRKITRELRCPKSLFFREFRLFRSIPRIIICFLCLDRASRTRRARS